jgi:YidC/Oxa1 family membrane protein insertase
VPVVYANIFQPLIDALEAVMVFIHDHLVGGSWGIAIIGLTVVTRILLLPLTLKQFKSMQALAHLQPQIKEMQAKYKDDKTRLNQEMMKFYQENKVNPLGSCLPLLAQMPVFLSLFYMLRIDLKQDICGGEKLDALAKVTKGGVSNVACDKVDPGSAQFLFIPDLTHKASGAVLITLIVLYVGSQLVSSLLMTVSADPTQQRLMLLLPFIFVVFIINFPAGLILYWITTNVWTIGQQYIVKRLIGPIRPEPNAVAAGAAGGGGSSNGPTGGGKSAKASKSGDGAAAAPSRQAAPPPSPRNKKKKRSGRRR